MKTLDNVNGNCSDSDQVNCLNLFFNRLDSVCVSYATMEMEIKKDVQLTGCSCPWLSSLGWVVDISTYLRDSYVTNPNPKETQRQKLEDSVSGVEKLGYNLDKMALMAPDDLFLCPTLSKTLLFKVGTISRCSAILILRAKKWRVNNNPMWAFF